MCTRLSNLNFVANHIERSAKVQLLKRLTQTHTVTYHSRSLFFTTLRHTSFITQLSIVTELMYGYMKITAYLPVEMDTDVGPHVLGTDG